jgi:hypothetical protein
MSASKIALLPPTKFVILNLSFFWQQAGKKGTMKIWCEEQ